MAPKRGGVSFAKNRSKGSHFPLLVFFLLCVLAPAVFFLRRVLLVMPNLLDVYPSLLALSLSSLRPTEFSVEYKDRFSGQTQVAFADAPDEALPLHCRPNFGAAILTQYKFKVKVSTCGLLYYVRFPIN
ncbi:hypothetical protein RIF29_09952 [Crotalaria pallida]|uniref:Transmembrane protein n=1 Tax=Crotalaria pallida TaxID=3830 RepID=A0AAN9FZU2_CROPI